MARQGINTGSAPNDGTGDTLLAGTLKINSNFEDVYTIFGDGTNLISFVSYASTAGYSTNCGIATTATSATDAYGLAGNPNINTSGVVTSSYADIGKITIQQPGAITDGPIEVGYATTMFRIKSDGMVGIGTSLPTSQLQVATFSNERPAIWGLAKGNAHGLRISSNELVTPAESFVVTNKAFCGIGSTAPSSRLDVAGDVKVIGITTLSGTTHLNGDITEKVFGNWNTTLTAIGGTLTVDVSQGSVHLGGLTTSVTSWDFTNVTALNSKATTVTLVNNAGAGSTYGDAVKVNGIDIAGGIRWVGGNPPPSTSNEDILTFSIIRDGTGSTRVYCSSSLNIL
tara:strand:- start:21427 stop:22449 length:1023 start_codon:yes stop_codon:yes gene_type:complete